MAALHHTQPSFNNQQLGHTSHKHGMVVEEIHGLIRVYTDGRVERPPIIPCTLPSNTDDIASRDFVLGRFTNLWVRIYAPRRPGNSQLPLLIYFHGGGFCVGSAAWTCYHEFLTTLASKANCVLVSVSYRLAPENRLPAAYDDGLSVLTWVKRVWSEGCSEQRWWLSQCKLSTVFIVGDSAGANIAYNVAIRLGSCGSLRPLNMKGLILIQPFFGAEERTPSERLASATATRTSSSALTLAASDAYWRLSLPLGTNRDHPWCNPLSGGASALLGLQVPSVMVCVSELDILKDRTLGFCVALAETGRAVETVISKGVGHAFQILHSSALSRTRTQELMSHIKLFIHK
ncbi:hypothetical protein SAY86_003809 [Trapa natans]|uniref:Alpha/beta hydrolase fold-3 domain-containing protein n=1 Tax=Trapa natans TaxID=22666 RepID=A0AAN7MT01_TRANT|nr:hypothetical protein SAY86_003809 [Trapa natans]